MTTNKMNSSENAITQINRKELIRIFAAFVRCARHIRNFPHPELTINQLRAEATKAETILQVNITQNEWDTINELAFKD